MNRRSDSAHDTGESSGRGRVRPRWAAAITPRPLDPLDFQPAIIRLQSQLPSPLPRAVLRALILLLALLLAWAAFGKIDIVAVAHGKLVPQSYAKIVQPAEQGIVREILVRDGQRVEAGQVLIRMDTAFSDADLRSVLAQYHTHDLIVRRVDAELAGRPLTSMPQDPDEIYAAALEQYQANRQALSGALEVEQAALARARSELRASLQMRDKLAELLPTYVEEEAAYLELVEQGLASRLATTEKTRERIRVEQDLRAQQHAIASAQATIAETEQRIERIRTESRRALQMERAASAQELARLEQELAKQNRRQELQELRAPQAGVVKDLATHTVGTVVSSGNVLMTVVPVDETLVAEVWVGNKDVGFLHPGQAARIKLAPFQFQKYGLLAGRVATVSADAVARDEGSEAAVLGRSEGDLAYKTLVDLSAPYLETEAGRFDLAPGMQVSAEIQLGRRTVLEYLLSPISKAFREAGRER